MPISKLEALLSLKLIRNPTWRKQNHGRTRQTMGLFQSIKTKGLFKLITAGLTSILDNKLVRRIHAKAHNREHQKFHRIWNVIFSLGKVELLPVNFCVSQLNSSFAKYRGHWPRVRNSFFLLLAADDESEYIYGVA